MSVATFKVDRIHLDGATEATITIDREGHQLLEVRPKGRRRTYTMSLADVAELVAYRVAKNEVVQNGGRVAVARRARRRI